MNTIRVNGVEIRLPDGVRRLVVRGSTVEADGVVIDLGGQSLPGAAVPLVLAAGAAAVTTDRSVEVQGPVTGPVTAGGSVRCAAVGGDVRAGGSVACDDVRGSVTAGGSVTCDDVGGSVHARGAVVAG